MPGDEVLQGTLSLVALHEYQLASFCLQDIECGEYRPAEASLEWQIDPTKCRVFGAGIFATKAGVMSQVCFT